MHSIADYYEFYKKTGFAEKMSLFNQYKSII